MIVFICFCVNVCAQLRVIYWCLLFCMCVGRVHDWVSMILCLFVCVLEFMCTPVCDSDYVCDCVC